jgi:hypothetical protein
MKSLEIEAYHGENYIYENLYDLYLINKFISIEEMINEKNKIKEKKGNVSVKISNKDDTYYISCKLDKGISNSSGKISHDPNVGLLSGLINFIHNNNNSCKILIDEMTKISWNIFAHKNEHGYPYIIEDIGIGYILNNNNIFPERCNLYSSSDAETRFYYSSNDAFFLIASHTNKYK